MNKIEKYKNELENLLFQDIYESETKHKFKKRQTACIFCGSGEGESKNSDGALTLYKNINMAKCFSCGDSFNIFHVVMHQNNLNFKEAILYMAKKYLNKNVDIDFKINTQYKKIRKKKEVSNKELLEEEKKNEEKVTYMIYYAKKTPIKEAEQYLKKRGIHIQNKKHYFQADKFEKFPAAVVFLDSEEKTINKRFSKNIEKLPKNLTYGKFENAVYDKSFREENERVFLNEGVINALSWYVIGESAIASFATTNYFSDADKFRKYFENKEVVIAYDPDKAGLRAAIKQAKFIYQNFYTKGVKILLLPEKEDANDLLQKGFLANYFTYNKNVVRVNKEFLDKEIVEIENDYKYCPDLMPDYYKLEQAKNADDKVVVTKEEMPENLSGELQGADLTNEIIKEEFDYCKKVEIFENNTVETFISTDDFPVLIKNDNLIWLPMAKKPFNEYYFLDKKYIIGKNHVEKKYNAAINSEDGNSKKPLKRIFITFLIRDYLNIKAINEAVIFTAGDIDYDYFQVLNDYTYNVISLPPRTNLYEKIARALGKKYIEMKTFYLKDVFTISQYLKNIPRVKTFLKQVNTALPVKFWEYDKKEQYQINLIKLMYFLNINGWYTYADERNKQGYIYVKVNNKIVEKYDQNNIDIRRIIRTYIDEWLMKRGENTNLRNKIFKSPELAENKLSGLKQIKPDFQNNGKYYENWFFANGDIWHITQNNIKILSQKNYDKYVWKDNILDFPSEVQKPLFEIKKTKKYAELHKSINSVEKGSEDYFSYKKKIAELKETEKWDIKIIENDFYFLQFLFLTSFIYWEIFEDENTTDVAQFFEQLNGKLDKEKIDTIKLHLINKISALGYLMKRFREPDEDFGVAILDLLDFEGDSRKGSSGGGKSLITKAISKVKKTLILKAEREDFTDYDHRYENYKGEDIIIADDMHKQSKIGNMLGDFSDGITVNVKHQKSIELTKEESPKIVVTRNYLDDEGERVDRRIFRMFVTNYFHDNKSGRYKTQRKPTDVFGKKFFQDDTPEEQNMLVNFFAQCYQAYMNFGVINPPSINLQRYRMARDIGELLLEFLDTYIVDENNYGYIERSVITDAFFERNYKSFNSYQRTQQYKSNQRIKDLIKKYCEYRDLVFNPEESLNNGNRIRRKSETKTDKDGNYIATEHFYINRKDWFNMHLNHDKNLKENFQLIYKTHIAENNEIEEEKEEMPF